jgi:haloalkane dehalogenase
MRPETDSFTREPIRFAELPSAKIAYRKLGSGPPLLCLHGWPFSSLSYRFIAPLLAERFTCFFPDTPGLGETEWSEKTPFAFAGQAETFKAFTTAVGLDRYSVLAHDTGATIARRLALIDPDRTSKLAILNTEIPGHRPPWIPLYQQVTRLPGSGPSFRLLLRSSAFKRSSLAFGGCFSDPSRLDRDFDDCYVKPVLESGRRMEGVIRYLGGIDWEMVDGFARTHGEIRCPVLLVWGADDPTFPIGRAKEILGQLRSSAGLREIAGAKLLVHEERASEVAREVIPFFSAT